MKKQRVLPLLVLVLFPYLFQSLAYASSNPESMDMDRRAIIPAGVTKIDLRTVLGDEVLDAENAWMLRADVYVILLNHEWSSNRNYEIIVLDTQKNTILSRTPVPDTDYLRRQRLEDGVLSLWFMSWRKLPEDVSSDQLAPDEGIIACVSPDGTVDIRYFTQSRHTLMASGKMAVFIADDGSLCSVDLDTGEEELLLQGSAASDAYSSVVSKYVPFWDELPEAPKGPEFEFYPFKPDHPLFSVRAFHVYKPLDEYRFVYTVTGWEWGAGFGIYDLQTRTDHRITGRGAFLGMVGDTLIGEVLRADANTYESLPLPEAVRSVFSDYVYSQWNTEHCDFDISPDGKLLAYLGREDPSFGDVPSIVSITDLQSGEVIQDYSIDVPFALEETLHFCDDAHLLLFCKPEPLGSAYILLFNVGERTGREH